MGIAVPHRISSLDVTNRYVLDYALRSGGRVLDYGCGAGRLVAEGRSRGGEFFGVDVFYGGSETRTEAERTGLFGDAVRDMPNGRIPFPDGFFDLVTNNQVMEHVEDLDAVLAEIDRVLRPGGTVLSIFPSRDVWREGHIGIPFSHRLPKGSRIRFRYTWALRSAGFGTWKEQAPTPRQWALDKLEWIDRWTRYRTRAEIFKIYGHHFSNRLRERDYIRYRLNQRRSPWRSLLTLVTNWPIVSDIGVALFRKLAFLVIESRKLSS